MMDKFFKIELDERFTFTISYLLISFMMGCVAISFVQRANRIFPEWSGQYAVILVVLISLERIFTIQKIETFEVEHRIIYHIAEWITIAVGLKILHYILVGFNTLLPDLAAWQANFTNFFAGDYMPVLLLLFAAWLLSGYFVNDMEELRVDRLDLRWEVGILENRRQDARSAIINRILWLGFIMLSAAVLTRLDSEALFGPFIALHFPAVNVLVFFLSALLLFSQTQYSLLRGRWLWHQTPTPASFGKTWLRYGFIFLLGLSVLAFLLPTHYTFGLLDLLRIVIATVIQIVLFIFALLMLPIGWLFSLLPGSKPIDEPLQTPDFSGLIQPGNTSAPDPILQMIQTILAWTFFVALVILSIRHFIRQNAPFFQNFRPTFKGSWLSNILYGLIHWLRRGYFIATTAISSARELLVRITKTTTRRAIQTLPNFKNLTPRQRVIFFYSRLLDRASATGIPRKPAETPKQYSSTLIQHIGESRQEIEHLTRSFEEARFSRHTIPAQTSHQAQQSWNRIVKALRTHKEK